MMNVESYRPQAKVTFHTERGELVARATNNPQTSLDDDIVRIRTSRDMGVDAPTFHIELTTRKPWHKWVASNDLVVIEMQRPPESMTKTMYGLVDDTRKTVNISEDGTPYRIVTVVGRGMAKAFIQFDVGVVPEAEYQSTIAGWLESSGVTLAGQTPSQIAEAVWDKICKPHMNYKWSSNKKLFDYVKKKFTDRVGIYLLDSSTIMNWQGSIWAFMKEVAEEPFYETYWEVEGNSPSLIMRPTPFNPSDWSNLPSYTIDDSDVVGDEIGRSDIETYTIYSVGAKTLFSPHDTYKTFGVLPYWYEPYSEKYGNRRLHVETAYTAIADSESTVNQVDTMRVMMADLFNWNILNNNMLNGNMTVQGKAKYRVGTRLRYKSVEDNSDVEYYITSVSHDFVNYGRYTTQLGVVRGMKPSERFRKPWDEYTEYSGLGIIPFDPVSARNSIGDGKQTGTAPQIDFVGGSKVITGARKLMTEGYNGVKIRYVFGGEDIARGKLDCSSFTEYIYRTYAGMEIGGYTGAQVMKGRQITANDALPGDLIFFKGTYNSPHIYGVSHVGIVSGGGNMIHNSSGSNGIVESSYGTRYWKSKFLMFRRVLSESQLEDRNVYTRLPTGGSTGVGATNTFVATAYGANIINLGAPEGHVATGRTKTGTIPKEGRTIAVDPKVIPLYSKVKIVSSYPGITGEYIAEDIGGAIKGNRIDIYFNDLPPNDPYAARKRMLNFGKREVQVTILRRGKG